MRRDTGWSGRMRRGYGRMRIPLALSPEIISVAEDRASLNLTTTLEKQRQLHLVEFACSGERPKTPTVMD